MAIVVARRPTTSDIQFNNKPDDLLLKDRMILVPLLYCVATLNVELSLNCLVTVTVTVTAAVRIRLKQKLMKNG
jgi:hypothetical protein